MQCAWPLTHSLVAVVALLSGGVQNPMWVGALLYGMAAA